METSTLPGRPDQLRESLEWAETTLKRQPDDLRQEYRRAGQAVSDALTRQVYSITLQLPCRILHNELLSVQPARVTLRAGNLAYRLFQKPCNVVLIDRLNALSRHIHPVVASIARLTCYLAAQELLTALPGPADLHHHYIAFDPQGQPAADPAAAEAFLSQLAGSIDHLRLAEQLYPSWTLHSLYNDSAARLTAHLVEQGRALSEYYTQQIIEEVLQGWRSGKLTRGLTLFIPYLDERRYRMEKYEVVVIPTGRILFRPEFVVGACRLAQRHVRKDSALSQATRWQLLSQLDSIIQVFEAETYTHR